MAEIRPLRAWRYAPNLTDNLSELVSPLFDVVSAKQRALLYGNPNNSIHISVPQNVPNEAGSYESVGKTLENWKVNGIIKQDNLPAIYVYYQYFTLSGSHKEYIRKGFVCNIRAYDFDENVILRHENTIPHAVNDRTQILAATQMNAAPTHGLYTDETHELEVFMDDAMTMPIYETEDYQGVKDVLAVIHDKNIIDKFINNIAQKKIILADGHHRYTSSLEYRKTQTKLNPNHTGKELYNFHLMYLTNTESDDLRILPTHRLILGLSDFDEDKFIQKLEQFFILKETEDAYEINHQISGKKWTFGLVLKEKSFKIRLKPEVFDTISWNFPLIMKELDLTVLHYFVLERCLGILGKDQRASENISFSRSFSECMEKVHLGQAQMALITQDVPMETIKKVCESGYTLPQKSTYFYPKVICGFLFGSIDDNEMTKLVDKLF